MRCFSQPDASRLILLKQFKNQSMTRFKEIGLLHSFCEGRNLIVWLRKEFRGNGLVIRATVLFN